MEAKHSYPVWIILSLFSKISYFVWTGKVHFQLREHYFQKAGFLDNIKCSQFFFNSGHFKEMILLALKTVRKKKTVQITREIRVSLSVSKTFTQLFPKITYTRYLKYSEKENLYSGTPLIRPPSGHGNLVVLTGWSY